MITVEQLKAGVEFKFKGSTYSAEAQEGVQDYYICNYSRYCGNVKLIGKTSFTMYTFVMGKYISVRVPFSECEAVVSESSTYWAEDEEEVVA